MNEYNIHRGTHSHGRSRPFSRRIKGINSYAMSRSKSGIEMNSLSEYLFVMKEGVDYAIRVKSYNPLLRMVAIIF